MNHSNTLETLLHNVCVDGVQPSAEIQQHVTSCRSCLDALASVSEIIKTGSSLSWYESLKKHYPCDEIETELDLIVAISADELRNNSPAVASHLSECALCAERYATARRLIEAESDGVLGPVIEYPEQNAAVWSEVKDKFFELTMPLIATLGFDSMGFKPFDPSRLPGIMVTEALPAMRSSQLSSDNSILQEASIELMPPTISEKLAVRFIYEAEELVTIEFSSDHFSSERLVIALFEAGEKSSIIEARSLSSVQPLVRFERLTIDEYFIEIRGGSGVSRFPLNLLRESE